MQATSDRLATHSREALLRRNAVFDAFFNREAPRLAVACRELSQRFLDGGRLLAFGQGAALTDAQHVAVEFVHPIIVGKRALPALDLGPAAAQQLPILLRPADAAMGFAFPEPSPAIEASLRLARERGALTFGLTGDAEYAFAPPDPDPFICQEAFEHLYHLLWETVHVFFEHREQGHDVGAAAFLYPFLGTADQPLDDVVDAVAASMLQKLDEVNAIRARLAEEGAAAIGAAATAIAARVRAGGKLLIFGNGGSATDANDIAIDCVAPPDGLAPVPALSLAADPAVITAVANDVGAEMIFTRQLIAHAAPEDIAVGLSTSGGSPNILAALAEARKRGLLTVALVGYGGGRIVREGLADHAIIVQSDYVPRIQEVQASAYHVLRRLIATQEGG